MGLAVMPTDFYSPIPRVPPPGDEIWSRESRFGVDTKSQIEFIENELTPYLRELPDGLRAAERYGFGIWNGQYQAGDAELLYALIRWLRPRRLLELGSGYSTIVSAAAVMANLGEGHRTELIAVDPTPRTLVTDEIEGLTRLERRDCRELSMERFLDLAAGDVLFVDTSHIVKLGSEVNWLVLEVLPQLAAGVWVQFHDVFLPFEYPRYLYDFDSYFNEQYLVQAFLQGNSEWEVKLGVAALHRRERERLGALIPSVAAGHPDPEWADTQPAAFWIRRMGG